MNFYHSVSANKAVNVQRLLDTYTGSVAAYSLRRLRSGHTGYAVEVRRASDNSTRDIGFDADGNFHISALEEFCSGTDGYVTVWYDQTSNGYDLTQSDAAKQPKIYDSSTGVIRATYGTNKPCVVSVSRDSTMNNSSFSSELKDGYSYYVSGDYIAYNSPFFFIKNPSTTNGRVGFHSNGTGQSTTYHQNQQLPNITSTGYANFGQRIVGAYNFLQNVNYDGSTTSNVHIIRGDGYNVFGNADGVEQSSVPALSTTVNSGININLFTQNSADTYRGQGKIHEFILWGQSKLSDQQALELSISKYYSIGRLNYDLPLDTYTNVAVAYSVRKLRSAYTGHCMEVYNGTSYANIGFNEFNELDIAAIASHCGSNDGLVSKWYSQGSSSNTAFQTDTTKMPKIYDGTTSTVFMENRKPIIQNISGSYPRFQITNPVTGAPSAHNFIVARQDGSVNSIMSYGSYANENQGRYMSFNSGGSSFAGSDLYVDGVAQTNYSGKSGFWATLSPSSSANIINSKQDYNSTSSTLKHFIGLNQDKFPMFSTQEIIIFDSSMDNEREAIEQNQNSYFSVY